jgi:hypothetical protein
MSVPECPPRPPVTVTANVVAPAGVRRPRSLDAERAVGAARRADRKRAVLLAVEVQQDRTGEERPVDAVGALARDTDLLHDGHEELERAMRDRLFLGQGHHRRDADAVVGAERRPVRREPLAVADELDAAGRRIVGRVRRALAHHVQVSLEHDAARGLAARGRGDADDEVPPRALRTSSPRPRPMRARARSPPPRGATDAGWW